MLSTSWLNVAGIAIKAVLPRNKDPGQFRAEYWAEARLTVGLST